MDRLKNIRVQYFALLREQRGRDEEMLATAAETPAELYAQLQQAHGLTLSVETLKVAVNDAYADRNARLQDGDLVVFIQPVAGG